MNHRQRMIAQHFSDVPELAGDDDRFGSLAGEGTDRHFSAHVAPNKGGVSYKLNCDNCGTPNEILLEWPELIIVASQKVPPNWRYKDGMLYPDVGCAHPGCGYITSVQITPDEAARHVKSGLAAQRISQPQVDHILRQLGSRK